MIRRTGSKNIRVLDIGCGRGEQLRAAIDEGVKEALGLEISEEMAAYARDTYGVEVLCETVEVFAAHTDRPFDAIFLSAVLEHVHDPDAFMMAVSKLTQPGAVVYIDVPNEPHLLSRVGNLLGKIQGTGTCYNLTPTWPPYHVFGFNPKALKVLLTKHDFVIDDLHVWASPKIPSRGGAVDTIRSTVATQINRFANTVGMASNLSCWARRV
jgi:SAM-dependent methyltransferase